MTDRPIRAMLWDADGVLQHGPQGWDWRDELDAAVGPGFAEAVFRAELPALRGEEPLLDCLTRVLTEWPHTGLSVDDLVDLWERTGRDEEAFAVLREIRASGVACHLATNQQDHRRAWMRDALGYDAEFDRVYYSCEIGAMKPDPVFFEAILADLRLPADQVGFVDDVESNVEAARRLGIRAIRHDPDSGAGALRAEVQALLRQAGS